MARKLSIVPGSIGVLLTALLIQTNAWWIRVLDFPRLPIAIFCFLALLLTFCCLHRRKSSNRILISLVALAFLYQPSGKTFNLHCVHPEPPRPGSSTYERDTELFVVGRRIKQEQEPSIVVGDLNDVAWSRTTKKFKHTAQLSDIGSDHFPMFIELSLVE